MIKRYDESMIEVEQSSFRDRDAFVIYIGGIAYRQLNNSYKKHFEMLVESGLYGELLDRGLILGHSEADVESPRMETAYKILLPEQIQFISYPYEWCFSQLRDAALLTLEIQLLSLKRGMCLKDASVYNVQFIDCKPVFMDTSSFEIYREGRPWTAYGQFCRHFLAPLLLTAYRDERTVHLLKSYMDGIPLDLAVKLLPARALLKPMVFMNIYLHSRYETREYDNSPSAENAFLSKSRLIHMVEALYAFIGGLRRKRKRSQWSEYYMDNSYSETARISKRSIIENLLRKVSPEYVWDIGSNTGEYGRIASGLGSRTVCMDSDFEAVEINYMKCRSACVKNILPLYLDILNPSPGTGWANCERKPLTARKNPDLVLALALMHHIIISGMITLEMAADFFSSLCRYLIIEFVPCSDKMAQQMLNSESNKSRAYTRDEFETAFGICFNNVEVHEIKDSTRSIYLMVNRNCSRREL